MLNCVCNRHAQEYLYPPTVKVYLARFAYGAHSSGVPRASTRRIMNSTNVILNELATEARLELANSPWSTRINLSKNEYPPSFRDRFCCFLKGELHRNVEASSSRCISTFVLLGGRIWHRLHEFVCEAARLNTANASARSCELGVELSYAPRLTPCEAESPET